VQSNQEMIKCAIFENLEDTLGGLLHIFISFFSTSQNDLKKITHLYHDDMYPWKKKSDFLEHF